MNSWYVYIIEATDARLYTGITTDLERRWCEHSGVDVPTAKATKELGPKRAEVKGNRAKRKGAKFFRGRKPKQLLFVKQVANRSEASQLEAKIKKNKRAYKLKLIQSAENQVAGFNTIQQDKQR